MSSVFGVLVLLGFLGFWFGMQSMMGAGWRRLAKAYAAHAHFHGEALAKHRVSLGRVIYRGGVTVTANAEGVQFTCSSFLHFAPRSFYVPWPHVTAKFDDQDSWLGLSVRLHFLRVKHLNLRISEPLAESLVVASGGAFSMPERESEQP